MQHCVPTSSYGSYKTGTSVCQAAAGVASNKDHASHAPVGHLGCGRLPPPPPRPRPTIARRPLGRPLPLEPFPAIRTGIGGALPLSSPAGATRTASMLGRPIAPPSNAFSTVERRQQRGDRAVVSQGRGDPVVLDQLAEAVDVHRKEGQARAPDPDEDVDALHLQQVSVPAHNRAVFRVEKRRETYSQSRLSRCRSPSVSLEMCAGDGTRSPASMPARHPTPGRATRPCARACWSSAARRAAGRSTTRSTAPCRPC